MCAFLRCILWNRIRVFSPEHAPRDLSAPGVQGYVAKQMMEFLNVLTLEFSIVRGFYELGQKLGGVRGRRKVEKNSHFPSTAHTSQFLFKTIKTRALFQSHAHKKFTHLVSDNIPCTPGADKSAIGVCSVEKTRIIRDSKGRICKKHHICHPAFLPSDRRLQKRASFYHVYILW